MLLHVLLCSAKVYPETCRSVKSLPPVPDFFNTLNRIAPGDRYQVVGGILEKAGTPPVEYLWQTIHQEEHQLWPIWPTGEYTL